MKVLIIEDDQKIVEIIQLVFQIGWPEVKLISTALGEKGVEMVETETPNIVILDLGLPDISGFDVLKLIRQFSSVPVLILTALGEEDDVVKGLAWGADDYVVKPFRHFELLARVKTLTRRQKLHEVDVSISYGPLHFGDSLHEFYYGDKLINLTTTEGRVLYNLMKNPAIVVTYSSLAEAVWGEDYPTISGRLKVIISRLRAKLEKDPTRPQLILNRVGVGYLLAKTAKA
jgi:two-component system KDP operon response regulator KdpE